MSPLRVLVVGNSIAGPSTAYWLSKLGFQITLLERSPFLRTGGQAVDIRTSGVTVMWKIPGLEASVRAASTRETGVCLVSSSGRSYGVVRATGDSQRQGLLSEYEIFRGDLSRELVALTEKDGNVKKVFGEQIASMKQKSGDETVDVEFQNGLPPASYDLVVACDGAGSRTRAMALECGVKEYVHPTNSWAAYFSTTEDLLGGSTIGHGHSAPGGRSFSLGTDPAGGCRVMFLCVNQSSTSMDSFRAAQAQGDDALKAYISQVFADVGWLTATALQLMVTSQDLYASESVQVKLPTLFKGRVVLVGDAGYATGPTGGGTSLAMTGGYILAGELGKHPHDIAAGLQGYEELMKPFIAEMQKIPPLVFTIVAPQTRWGIWIRNCIFAAVAWSGVADFAQRYLGAAFASSEEFPVPEYKWVK
jgi:2-polyprenyl-6-methoxyphenol hydroxylase-like FAD-dependent oxidoreductase